MIVLLALLVLAIAILVNGDAFLGESEPMWFVPKDPKEWEVDCNGRFHQFCTWAATVLDLMAIVVVLWMLR